MADERRNEATEFSVTSVYIWPFAIINRGDEMAKQSANGICIRYCGRQSNITGLLRRYSQLCTPAGGTIQCRTMERREKSESAHPLRFIVD